MKPVLVRWCPNCRTMQDVELSKRSDWDVERKRYNEGELAQHVWPDATPIQREQLVSGLCSERCWDHFMGEIR